MRVMVAVLMLFAVTMPAVAQDRLPPIPTDKQTPEQQKASEAFPCEPETGCVRAVRAAPVAAPEVMLRAMAMGDFLRYRTVFPTRLNELIILDYLQAFHAAVQMVLHEPIALKEGLDRGVVDAIADGRPAMGMAPDEELIYEFCTELLRNNSVSNATYARAVQRFGEQGMIEMVGVVGSCATYSRWS